MSDNVNPVMLAQLVGVALFIWAFMEGMVKSTIKTFSSQIISRWGKEINPELMPYMFKFSAFVLGVVAVLSYGDLSFIGVWDMAPNGWMMEIIDVLVTGYVISRGERGVHSMVDAAGKWLSNVGGVPS